MRCNECNSGVCKRRGAEIPKHFRLLCARDARYAIHFDRVHGVVDSSVIPPSANGEGEAAPKRRRTAVVSHPPRAEIKGLGDVFSRSFALVGIRKRGCGGCHRRESWLNDTFPADGSTIGKVVVRMGRAVQRIERWRYAVSTKKV